MSENNGPTTIQTSKQTKDELKALGKKGETYEEILRKLIKAYKEGGRHE